VAEKIEFDLGVKNNQLNKTLDVATKKAANLDGVLETALGVFGGNVITKGFDLFISGLNQVVDVFGDALKASSDNQVEINNLNSALSRAGILTRETSLELQGFADAIEATTTQTGGAVIDTLAYLSSLTRLDKDGLQAATKASLDLSQALGIDLNSATNLVAKAANGNITAFQRYGIEIQKGTTDAQTFANTLEKLNSQFGGAATSQLNTTAGAYTALANAYEKSIEPLGDIIIQNPIVTATINELKDTLLELSASVFENKDALIDFVQDGILLTAASAQVLFDALDGITVVSKALVNSIVAIKNAIVLGVIEPFRLAYDAVLLLLQNIPILGSQFENLVNPLEDLANSIRGDLIGSINDISNSVDGNVFRSLSDGVSKFGNDIIETSTNIKLSNQEIKNSNAERVTDEDETDKAIIEKRKQLNFEILSLQQSLATEQATAAEELRNIQLEAEGERDISGIERIAEIKRLEVEAIFQAEKEKNALIDDSKEQELANEKSFAKAKLALVKINSKAEIDAKRELALQESQIFNSRIAATQSFLSLGEALSKNGSSTAKALASANAVVSTYAGATQVLGDPAIPTLAKPAFVAATIASGLANVARINGVQFEEGGIVGQTGATKGPDNRVATIRDGEMILNAEQQKKLFDAVNSGNMGGGDIILQLDGREIARAVRTQINAGFKLA
jgi:hypothetical protein